MKNRLIVSLLMLFVGMSAAFSQGDARPRPFELGVFASPALNWMHSSTDECNNKGLSFSGSYGINLDINMFQATSNYYLRTGINIKHLKGKLTYNDLKTVEIKNDSNTILNHQLQPMESSFSMTYISIPTALKLQTNPLGDFIVYSVFGLDNSFCISSNRKDKEDGQETANPKDNMKNTLRFREALMISIGGEYIISNNTRLAVGLMFNNGFTNLFNKNFTNAYKDGSSEKVVANNRTIELQIGLIF